MTLLNTNQLLVGARKDRRAPQQRRYAAKRNMFKSLTILSLLMLSLPFSFNAIADSDHNFEIIKVHGKHKSIGGSCEAILSVNGMGGFLTMEIVRNSDKKRSQPIDDISGITWLNDHQLVYSVSPIYGQPGIYSYDCNLMKRKLILSPKNKGKAYPDGADYFELHSVVIEPALRIYFYYAYDVDEVDFKTFRVSDNIFQVGLDGFDFKKAE